MYLSNIKLWNFRKFGKTGDDLNLKQPHLSLDFKQGINLLVGENDSGKSCIIDAIKLILKTHSLEWIKVEDDDFYHGSVRLRIECIFRDLKDSEAKNFTEWLGIEELTTATGVVNKIPYLRLILDVKKIADKILPFDVRGGTDEEGRIISAEAKEYLKATYLKPLRNAKAELVARKNSRLSQILYTHPVFKDKDAHELVKILGGANKEIKNYFEDESHKATNGFVVLETLKIYLTSFLKRNSPQDTKFHIDNPKLKNILEILKLTLYDDCCGLGTFNLLFIATELLHLKRVDYDGLKLGLIEEAEAHLHPQAQLRVMTALEKEAVEGGVQLILTTHSPNLASKVRIENLILCHDCNVYSLGSDYTRLKNSDYSFLERFLDVTKANLFFAQGVILVEGDSENILIPTIAKLIDKNLFDFGISIINVGGVSFLRYSKIFQRKEGSIKLTLPVSVLTDLDVKPENESSEKTKKNQEKELKYSGTPVKTFVSPHWTLEYCIAFSQNLRQLFFKAIKLAGKEMNEDGYTGKLIEEDWSDFSNSLSDVDLAKKIRSLLVDKKISKTITAQYFSKLLEEKMNDEAFISSLKKDENIKYIIDSIDYAASNSNN